MDTDTGDLASSGFGNTLTRDGQGSATANLPMNGFKHTGAALATAATDYALLQQIKNGWAGLPANLQLNASVSSSLLTVALKAADGGGDPTASNPIYIPFRDSTLSSGDPVILTVSSALSISTFATGATLGSSNSVPFRFWVVAFNNGGTVVLGLINCSNATSIIALNEAALQTSIAMSGAATSAGVFYTPNGTTITSKAFRILGYVEYSAGLGTAGTYGSAPTTVQLFGPGIKKPGDTVQVVYATATSSQSATGANTNMLVGASITPASGVNLISANINFAWNANAASSASFFISRGTAPSALAPQFSNLGNATVGLGAAASITAIDGPTTATRSSYNLFASGSNVGLVGGQSVILTELMG